jgi:membrane protease YdiL (CAAX protease family)
MTKAVLIAITQAVVVSALLLLDGESLWPAVLAYHALCLGIPLVARHSFKQAGLVLLDARGWLPSTIALSALLVAAGGVTSWLLEAEMFLPEGLELLLGRIEPWWTFVVYSLCVNPLLEEFFWRGFLLPKTGVALGGGLFWLMHAAAASVFLALPDAVVFTLPTLAAAVVWGWMRQRLHTLWPCVLTHAAADTAILLVARTLRP